MAMQNTPSHVHKQAVGLLSSTQSTLAIHTTPINFKIQHQQPAKPWRCQLLFVYYTLLFITALIPLVSLQTLSTIPICY